MRILFGLACFLVFSVSFSPNSFSEQVFGIQQIDDIDPATNDITTTFNIVGIDTATGAVTTVGTVAQRFNPFGGAATGTDVSGDLTYNPNDNTFSITIRDRVTGDRSINTHNATSGAFISSIPVPETTVNPFESVAFRNFESVFALSNGGGIADLEERIAANETNIINNTTNIERNYNAIQKNAKDIDKNSEGVAMAMALANSPNLEDYEDFAITLNVGTFEGENAMSFGLMGRINKNITIQGGLGVGLNQGTVGGAGGVKIGW